MFLTSMVLSYLNSVCILKVRRYICGYAAGFFRVKSVSSSLFHQKEECASHSMSVAPRNNGDFSEKNDPTVPSSPSSLAAAVSAARNLVSVERLLSSMHELLETRLRIDARLRHETDRNQQMMSEWLIAAAVIDRFCFIVFSLCFLVGTAVLCTLAMFIEN